MSTYTVDSARTRLSSLIEQACAGEEVIIALGENPLVQLVPLRTVRQRRFGAMHGQARVDDTFFDPLPDEELAAWQQS